MEPDYITSMKETTMFKEIIQAPDSIKRTLESIEEECFYASELISKSSYIYIVGSGTSFHAGMVLQVRLLNRGIPAIAVKAPEFSSFLPDTINRNVTAILISQSGESRDILDSLYAAQEKKISTICITNTADSSLAMESDIPIITGAGIENSLAATKTFVSCLAACNIIVEKLGNPKSMPDGSVVGIIENFLTNESEKVFDIARTVKGKVVFLGNGALHALALEGALKFKETSNMETEAYPIREYLHGPIQSLNSETTVILLRQPSDEVDQVMEQMSKQTGSIISIGFKDGDLVLPVSRELDVPILFAIPIQLMANYKSVSLGLDPDHPQHLNKVVK